MGLILLEFWAKVRGMGIGMLCMHTHEVISRSSLHHDPSRVIFEAMAQRPDDGLKRDRINELERTKVYHNGTWTCHIAELALAAPTTRRESRREMGLTLWQRQAAKKQHGVLSENDVALSRCALVRPSRTPSTASRRSFISSLELTRQHGR